MQVLDPLKGSEMFDVTKGTSLRPHPVIISAAMFALGPVGDERAAMEFLKRRTSKGLKSKQSKIYSILAQAHGRAMEQIRKPFVSYKVCFKTTLSSSKTIQHEKILTSFSFLSYVLLHGTSIPALSSK